MVTSISHVELFKEMGSEVFASSAVLGVRIEVEGIVTGLSELAVSDDFTAEMRVHGV